MTILAYDEVMLREPRLLVPKMQPFGPTQINWSSPLTNGLVGCWPLSGVHDTRNLATLSDPPFVFTGGPPSGSDAYAKYIDWATGDYGTLSAPRSLNSWAELTISVLVKTNKAEGESYARVIEKGSNTEFCLNLYGWPTTETCDIQLGTDIIVTTSFTIDDAWHAYVVSMWRESASIGTIYGYRDGRLFGSGQGTNIGALTGGLYLNQYGGGAYNANRPIRQLCAWRRLLSEGEIQSISQDPYQFMVPLT